MSIPEYTNPKAACLLIAAVNPDEDKHNASVTENRLAELLHNITSGTE